MTAQAAHHRRHTTRSADLALGAMRTVVRLALAILVGFHAWLLWTHLVGGQPLEPQTAARWIIAAAIMIGFRALQRHGLSLFWGKRAVVLWLLVVVVHCHAIWSSKPVAVELGVPETISLLAQVTAPAAAVLGLFFLGLFAAYVALRPAVATPHDRIARAAGLPASGCVFAFSPRPPPVR